MSQEDIFNKLREQLISIDQVVDEEGLRVRLERDINDGFTPDTDYSVDNPRRPSMNGYTNAMWVRKTGVHTKTIVAEVTLYQQGQSYTRLHLRGTESLAISHPGLADQFLIGIKYCTDSSNYFDVPKSWPGDRRLDLWDQSVTMTGEEGVSLTIQILGGEKYRVEGDNFIRFGTSAAFGGIPIVYEPQVDELFNLLPHRKAFRGLKIVKE